MNLRDKRVVLAAIFVAAGMLFAAGIVAGYLSRHDKICPDGSAPLKQRSEVIGSTQYLCRGGVVVTK